MRVQHLKILYALAGSLFAGYWSEQLIAYHVANRVPISIGTMLGADSTADVRGASMIAGQ